MAFYSGTTMRIKIGTKTLFHETDATFQSSLELKELASKDITGTEHLPGKIDWSLSCSSLIGNEATLQEDLATLSASHLAKTKLAVTFSTDVTGDVIYSGDVYIESLSIKATNNDTVTGDFNFKGDGIYTVGVVA